MADACGHNFCQNCLLVHIGGPYRSLLAEIGGGNEWNCPDCRSEQSKKPDELMRNRLVEKAVESLNDNLSFNATVTQNEVRNLCRRHNLELTLCKFCIICNLYKEYAAYNLYAGLPLFANSGKLTQSFFRNFISPGPISE